MEREVGLPSEAYSLLTVRGIRRQRMVWAAASCVAFAGMLAPITAAAAPAAVACSCVAFVRSQTGLRGGPATAAGYTSTVMWNDGYKRVSPAAGAIVVMDAWAKGASGSGHMGVVRGAYYDGRAKMWHITVLDADWNYPQQQPCIKTHTFTGTGRDLLGRTFTWGDLYGVNFYVRR